LRILVIEDTPELLELLEIVLRAEGHRVSVATSGWDGLALARGSSLDLILVDVEMPGMNGFEVLRHLRNDPLLAKVPIVALTAFATAADRERVLTAGFTGYITKPIRPREFGRQLETYFRYDDSNGLTR
jgi:two-component system cell cycle response regulator